MSGPLVFSDLKEAATQPSHYSTAAQQARVVEVDLAFEKFGSDTSASPPAEITKVIEEALRAAGLMG
ncbi:hypothetical protein [Mesorhizobium sp. M0674]|uniref:hypothetical protein n=1 Tax=unclassified Mesorhizobium TaxID=325217 RepID=UPI003336B5AB